MRDEDQESAEERGADDQPAPRWKPLEQPPTCQRCEFYGRYRPLSDAVDGPWATDCKDCNDYRDNCIRDAAIRGEGHACWQMEQQGCVRCHTRRPERAVTWRDKQECALCDQCFHSKLIPESRW